MIVVVRAFSPSVCKMLLTFPVDVTRLMLTLDSISALAKKPSTLTTKMSSTTVKPESRESVSLLLISAPSSN